MASLLSILPFSLASCLTSTGFGAAVTLPVLAVSDLPEPVAVGVLRHDLEVVAYIAIRRRVGHRLFGDVLKGAVHGRGPGPLPVHDCYHAIQVRQRGGHSSTGYRAHRRQLQRARLVHVVDVDAHVYSGCCACCRPWP